MTLFADFLSILIGFVNTRFLSVKTPPYAKRCYAVLMLMRDGGSCGRNDAYIRTNIWAEPTPPHEPLTDCEGTDEKTCLDVSSWDRT